MPVRTFAPRGSVPLSLMILSLFACAPSADGEGSRGTPDGTEASSSDQEVLNALSQAEREAGWRLLFDGESLDQWRGFRRDVLPDGWQAVEGAMTILGQGGDIITREQFGSFELALDWRVEAGGNSGILYLVTEDPDVIWHAAPELQILDDAGHVDGGSPLTSAGSAYGLYPAPRGVVNPAGAWNSVRLVVDGTHVEHWMNGQQLLEYELGSEDFEGRVAESKFAVYPSFALARRGHVGLQDHGDPVWYRNIKIRELP
jgi:hypothetical protein